MTPGDGTMKFTEYECYGALDIRNKLSCVKTSACGMGYDSKFINQDAPEGKSKQLMKGEKFGECPKNDGKKH